MFIVTRWVTGCCSIDILLVYSGVKLRVVSYLVDEERVSFILLMRQRSI